jgi:DNA-binding transcriptional regulator LsrR (DeoR family)
MSDSPRKDIDQKLIDRIVYFYREEDLTQRQIAKRCQCSIVTVAHVLKTSNVKINYGKRFL